MNCYANSCDANEFKVEWLVVSETRFCAWPLQKESLVIPIKEEEEEKKNQFC